MTDVLIIGAGIAGMTAAVVSSNAGLSVRLIDKTGLAMSANDFSCFSSIPFFNGLTPLNICEILAKDIEKCGIELTPAKAVSVSKGEDSFKVMCDIGDFLSRAVIISYIPTTTLFILVVNEHVTSIYTATISSRKVI